MGRRDLSEQLKPKQKPPSGARKRRRKKAREVSANGVVASKSGTLPVDKAHQTEDDYLFEDGPSPNKKRREGSKVAGLRTNLTIPSILEAPEDVFEHVLSFLHPVDFLSIARTTKSLRAFMLVAPRKASWMRAFVSIGFPGRPEIQRDSGPWMASFLFEMKCQNIDCVQPILHIGHLKGESRALRDYFCGGCSAEFVIDDLYVAENAGIPKFLIGDIPQTSRPIFSPRSRMGAIYFLRSEIQIIAEKYRLIALAPAHFIQVVTFRIKLKSEREARGNIRMQLGEWHNTWLRQMGEKRQMFFLKHYISVSSNWKREYLNEVLLDMRWDALVSLPHPPKNGVEFATACVKLLKTCERQ